MLDLSNWYLTLPTGKERDPDDVYRPALTTYVGSYFRLNDSRDGVAFIVNGGGVTTSGSSYPRSELREMSAGKVRRPAGRTSGARTRSTSGRR